MKQEVIKTTNNELTIPEDAIKLSDEEKASIEPLLKGLGEVLLNEAQNANLTNQFDKAIIGSYICKIDPDQHLAKFTDGSGATIGMVFDGNNKLKSNAKWFENNATLNTATTINLVSNAFSVLSALTGQYYLASINNEIKNLRKEISAVESMIEAEHESELEWIFKCLNDNQNHIEYIKKDPNRLSTFLNTLDDHIDKVGKEILYYKRIINNKVKCSISDDLETIKLNAEKLEKYTCLMQTAVQLLCCLKMLKIYATTKIEDGELFLYKEEIETTLDDFLCFVENKADSFVKYLDKAKSLNKYTTKEKFTIVGMGLGTIAAYAIVLPLGNSSLRGTISYMSDTMINKEKEKEELTGKAEGISDDSWISGVKTSLNNYIDSKNKPIELIVSGEDIYWRKASDSDE